MYFSLPVDVTSFTELWNKWTVAVKIILLDKAEWKQMRDYASIQAF